MEYRKPARTTSELIELMKKRGVCIPDEAKALDFLRRVSFFRLKGYLLHFERKIPGNITHAVPEGTTFDSVLDIYELDRKLRLLMFEAVERIEICFRSAICDTYSIGYKDPHWLLQGAHFVDGILNGSSYHQRLMKRVRRDIGLDPHPGGETRDQEVFVEHYLTTYTDPPIPPAWVLAECLSLSVWSLLYGNLANRDGPLNISKVFCIPPAVLGSWMHALTVARNICAHHGRIWNRVFVFKPANLIGYDEHFSIPARFYAQASAAAYLLRRIEPHTTWHIRMKQAIQSCPVAESVWLGLIPNWETKQIWSEEPLPPHLIKTLLPRR